MRKFKPSIITAVLLVLVVIGAVSKVGNSEEELWGGKLSGVSVYPKPVSIDVESVARFAVDEHNKRENTLLRLGKVLEAKEQVVAGKIYHLTLEVLDYDEVTVYEAKVWVKPWMNFQQLQEFKRVFRERFGWHRVPVYDSDVQDAANHAVRQIQQRSNSLSPYKLLEVLQADAEVVRDYIKYSLLLKLKKGSEEENRAVQVHKAPDGSFFMNLMGQGDVQ